MKTLLLILVYVVIDALYLGLLLVGIWLTFGIDITPQNLWVTLGVLLVAVVAEFSYHWLHMRGYRFSDMYHNSTRPVGAFGVGMYLGRKPGGPPEVPASGPHKFPDGDY